MNEYISFEIAKKYLHEACVALENEDGLMLEIKFDQEPKADVVEVVHGKWIPSRFKTLQEDGWFECSVCGVGNKLYDRGIRKSDVPYIDGKPYELKNIANYCPNCGAKMDGE